MHDDSDTDETDPFVYDQVDSDNSDSDHSGRSPVSIALRFFGVVTTGVLGAFLGLKSSYSFYKILQPYSWSDIPFHTTTGFQFEVAAQLATGPLGLTQAQWESIFALEMVVMLHLFTIIVFVSIFSGYQMFLAPNAIIDREGLGEKSLSDDSV